MLNQKQEEVQRKRTEAEAIKENLEAQIVIIDKKRMNWINYKCKNVKTGSSFRSFC